MAESGFEKVAETGELSPGEMKSVLLGQEAVLLANVDGNFYVIGACPINQVRFRISSIRAM